MKILKIASGILIFINLVFFATPLFLNSEYDINYSQGFDPSMKTEVFDLLADFNRHKEWNPWFQSDSSVTFEISKPPRGLGSYYKWTSVNQGSGLQKVTQFQEGQFIEVLFDSGDQGQAHSSYQFVMEADSLKVTWRIWGESNGYVGRYMSHFMEGMMTPVMEAGFKNLMKAAVESDNIPKTELENPLDSLAKPLNATDIEADPSKH